MQVFLVKKKGETAGSGDARILWRPNHLHDWLEHREPNVVEKLMNTFQSLEETEDVVSLVPYFGGKKYYKDWKNSGFSKDDRSPYHLLMKKELKDEKKSEKWFEYGKITYS